MQNEEEIPLLSPFFSLIYVITHLYEKLLKYKTVQNWKEIKQIL